MTKIRPTFQHERALFHQGFRLIVGVDEVGSGALAGPVLAGAVVLPFNSRLGAIADSKLLTAREREVVCVQIQERATAWAVGRASVEEINRLGIRPATLLAMKRAVEQIPHADFVLVDAWTIPEITIKQRGIIRGDRTVKSIAAGSIVAKVARDQEMSELAERYPVYGFDQHKGYGTLAHKRALRQYGACVMHRQHYKPVQEVLAQSIDKTGLFS